MAGSVGRKIVGVVQLGGAIGVAGVLVAAILLPFTGGLGLVARNSVRAFDEQPCDVDPGPPPQRSVMLSDNGGPAIATFYSQNREVIPYQDMPDVMRKAIIAIEDRRFLEHHGVDTEALVRAVVKNSQSGTVVQGGSTLTMQYIKNVRLYSAKTDAEQRSATEQTSARKLIEARCALELEHKLSKDEILSRYLNITYFGASAYGVQTAARTYFGKPAKRLTLPEAALLAGLVQSPSRFDPYKSKKLAKDRRDTVLTEMQSLGYINAKQAAQAKATPIAVVPKAPRSLRDCANATAKIVNAGFFCDYVKRYLASIGFPQQRLDAGGYTIYTTLNTQIQSRIQAAMPFDRWLNRKSVAVMDVLDPRSGKVLAFGVSRRYGVNPKDPNVTSDPLNVKAAAGAGSTYKTYTLVSALESKTPLRSYKISVGDSYTSKVCSNYDNGQKVPYQVKNAGTYGNGPWNLETATYESVNTFFVALLDQRFNCDLSGPVKAAVRMGLNSFKPYAKATIDGKSASFTLGPDPTSPLDIASSYGTLANRGVYCPPSPVQKIVGPDRKAIALPESACERRVNQGIADTVSRVLEKDTSQRGGTAVSAFAGLSGGSHPIAGKTGTASALVGGESNGNSAAWFIGYTPDLVASVAVYNQKKSTEPLVDVPGKEGANVFGAYSATIWRAALEPILLQKGSWSFPPEDPEVVNGDSVGVPSVVGLDPATATGILQASGFQVTIAPERKDSQVPAGLVAEQSPSGRGAPGQMVFLYLSSGNAPQGGDGESRGHGRPTRPPGPGG
jgi:membrane peptidoglycan carboxypeptidase